MKVNLQPQERGEMTLFTSEFISPEACLVVCLRLNCLKFGYLFVCFQIIDYFVGFSKNCFSFCKSFFTSFRH